MTAPLAGISSMATRHVLAELADDYRRACGQAVAIEPVGGVDAARRVAAGEAFDFVVLAADAIAKLAAAGHVDAASRVDVARSGIAVAVAAGAARPDIGSEAALRDAVLAAQRIGYSTGPSGSCLLQLFARWGIADTLAPRLRLAPPGVPVAALIARGEVEFGFQQLSELVNVAGIDVVGPLPDAIQQHTVFSAALCRTTSRADATRAFLACLVAPRTAGVKQRHGMEAA